MTWLFPTTLFLLAFLVWIGGLLMVQSQHRNILTICCTILASLSVVLLLQAQAIAAAGILICIMLFSTILYFGFDLPWEKEKIPTGPLSSFLHQEGIAITYLEPKGQVQIQDKILPAITEGCMIPKGSKVKVIRCGQKILVVEKNTESI